MQKALVIHSGGQDSTTCLLWALRNFDEVHAVNFQYGQRHKIEGEYAQKTCNTLGVPLTVVPLPFFELVTASALIGEGDVSELNDKGLPNSFVPNRNQVFITIAHQLAQKMRIRHIVGGMCQTDYSGYPDCRQQFINAIEYASNVGSDSKIKIHTPLMQFTKAETFALAEELGGLELIINSTLSCYEGDETLNEFGLGCGKCPACQLRKRGYSQFCEVARS